MALSGGESKRVYLADILPHGVRSKGVAGFFKRVPQACTDVCDGVGSIEIYTRDQHAECTRCRTNLDPSDYRVINFS